MADLNEFPYVPDWARGKEYQNYWDHWRSLQRWYNNNYQGSNSQSNLLNTYGQHLYLWNHYFQYFMQQYKIFTTQTLSQNCPELNHPRMQNPYYESEEVDEADLAYKNFLKVSMKHKKERGLITFVVNTFA